MPTSRHFGPVTSDYTEAKRGEVRLDLNVVGAVTQELIDELDQVIDDLEALRAVALASFTAAMADDTSTPTQFWQFHHDEVDSTLTRDQFVAALELVRLGLYPTGERFAVLDFRVRGPQTDQLLVAKFARDRSLTDVSWES